MGEGTLQPGFEVGVVLAFVAVVRAFEALLMVVPEQYRCVNGEVVQQGIHLGGDLPPQAALGHRYLGNIQARRVESIG